jgi:predicted peroxiredoxin
MRKTALTVVVVAALLALGSLPLLRAQQATETRDGVLIHLSHGATEPHRVLMALRMAEMMAEDKDVLVYFDLQGIEVVLKDAGDIQYKEFPAAQAQLKKLVDRKVTLMACPGCLKAAGKTGADLAPGIQAADKKAFFSFTKGRILTLDY